MRILCVIDTFRIGGGAQTQLAGLAVMLKSRGHDVATLSYYKNSPDVSCEPHLEDNGVVNICLDEANNMFDSLLVLSVLLLILSQIRLSLILMVQLLFVVL